MNSWTPLLLSPPERPKCNRQAPLVQWDKTNDCRNLHQGCWQLPHPIRHQEPLLPVLSPTTTAIDQHGTHDERGRTWKPCQRDPFEASSGEWRILLVLNNKIINNYHLSCFEDQSRPIELLQEAVCRWQRTRTGLATKLPVGASIFNGHSSIGSLRSVLMTRVPSSSTLHGNYQRKEVSRFQFRCGRMNTADGLSRPRRVFQITRSDKWAEEVCTPCWWGIKIQIARVLKRNKQIWLDTSQHKENVFSGLNMKSPIQTIILNPLKSHMIEDGLCDHDLWSNRLVFQRIKNNWVDWVLNRKF